MHFLRLIGSFSKFHKNPVKCTINNCVFRSFLIYVLENARIRCRIGFLPFLSAIGSFSKFQKTLQNAVFRGTDVNSVPIYGLEMPVLAAG